MKRRFLWTATILLVSGGTAVASDDGPALVFAQADSAEAAPEGAFSPSDEPILQAPLPEAAPAPEAASPETVPAVPVYPVNGGTWTRPAVSGAGCTAGCDAGLQCCERVPHHLDNVWDNYCAEKTHHHGSLFSWLHIKRSPHCACPPAPACDHGHCDCRLSLPKFPRINLHKHCHAAPCHAAPCESAPCEAEPCRTCPRPLRSLLGHCRRACCGGGCGSVSLDGSVMSSDAAVEDPAFAPPVPVAPPATTIPELPPVEPTPEAQGWLPTPWLNRLPL